MISTADAPVSGTAARAAPVCLGFDDATLPDLGTGLRELRRDEAPREGVREA